MHLRPSSVIHLILVLGVAALGCATEPSEAQPHAGGAAAAEAGQGGGLSSGSGGAAGTGATSGAPSGGSSGGTTTGGRANGGATAGGTTSDGASTGATTGAGAAGMGSAGLAGAGMGGASSGGLAGTAGAPLGGAPSGGVAGGGGAAIGGSGGAPTDGFVHPGVVFNRADLERMKSNLGVEPWKAGHERFRARNTASLSYAMQGPFATVGREPNLNRSQYENDMTAVRDQAIMWYLTGTRAYADKAIQILNAWASTHTTWSGGTPGLLSGDFGYFAATGAEIIRHTGAGWSAADIARVETYFKDVVYRLNISVGRPEDPVGEANQGASHLKSMIAIAVFANDRAKFDYTLNSFRNGVCTSVTRNFLPTGQNAEAGRDQPHPLGGLQTLRKPPRPPGSKGWICMARRTIDCSRAPNTGQGTTSGAACHSADSGTATSRTRRSLRQVGARAFSGRRWKCSTRRMPCARGSLRPTRSATATGWPSARTRSSSASSLADGCPAGHPLVPTRATVRVGPYRRAEHRDTPPRGTSSCPTRAVEEASERQ